VFAEVGTQFANQKHEPDSQRLALGLHLGEEARAFKNTPQLSRTWFFGYRIIKLAPYGTTFVGRREQRWNGFRGFERPLKRGRIFRLLSRADAHGGARL
jgi:hypothetical protein